MKTFISSQNIETVLAVLLIVATLLPSIGQAQEDHQRPPAEILWDTYGVPHIYARNEEQAFRAYGYSQMEAHGDLLLRLYAIARGRAAEYYGASFVDLDTNTRTLGIPERGALWYHLQTLRFRNNIDAFVRGINEYAEQHPDRLAPEGRTVLPVTSADVVAHSALVLALFTAAPTECSLVLAPAFGIGSQPASNGWALGPEHTASGNTMLLVNPHLFWLHSFLKFFEAQIVAPGVNFTGATLVGLPVPVLGFDDNHGWTHTNNTADACDVYVLNVHGDNYLLDSQLRAFDIMMQTIKVKQVDGSLCDLVITIKRTVHGPVFNLGPLTVAVRVNGQEIHPIAGLFEQFWEMARARNLAQFTEALRRNQLPMINTIYADKDKHTLLAYTAIIPVRSTGDYLFWNRPLPGDRSDLIWTETHPFDAVPITIDPPSGFVQNSNSVPWYMTLPPLNPDDFPPYFAPRELTAISSFSREQRGLKMILENDVFAFDDLYKAKFNTFVESTDHLLNELIHAARNSNSPLAKDAARVLTKWDRHSERDSQGTVLYFAFYEAWIQLTIEKRLQTEPDFIVYQDFFGGTDFFRKAWSPRNPLDTPRGLADPELAVHALETATQQLQDAGVPLDVEWGEIARFRGGSVDVPGWGGGDPVGVFPFIYFTLAPDGRLQALAGESFIALVEFGKRLNAKVLLTHGNSSRLDSPHNGDQLVLLSNKQMRDPWRTREEVLQHLESMVVLP